MIPTHSSVSRASLYSYEYRWCMIESASRLWAMVHLSSQQSNQNSVERELTKGGILQMICGTTNGSVNKELTTYLLTFIVFALNTTFHSVQVWCFLFLFLFCFEYQLQCPS